MRRRFAWQSPNLPYRMLSRRSIYLPWSRVRTRPSSREGWAAKLKLTIVLTTGKHAFRTWPSPAQLARLWRILNLPTRLALRTQAVKPEQRGLGAGGIHSRDASARQGRLAICDQWAPSEATPTSRMSPANVGSPFKTALHAEESLRYFVSEAPGDGGMSFLEAARAFIRSLLAKRLLRCVSFTRPL